MYCSRKKERKRQATGKSCIDPSPPPVCSCLPQLCVCTHAAAAAAAAFTHAHTRRGGFGRVRRDGRRQNI